MQRLSYPTENVLSNKITRNNIVLSFKDSPQKPLRRQPFLPQLKTLILLVASVSLVASEVWPAGASVPTPEIEHDSSDAGATSDDAEVSPRQILPNDHIPQV